MKLFCGAIIIAIALVSFAFLVFRLLVPVPILAGHSEIDIEPPAQYAGRIEQGSVGAFSFSLRNRLSENIEIISIVPTCNCTSIQFSRSILAPGSHLQVNGFLNSKDHEGPFGALIQINGVTSQHRYFSYQTKVSGIAVTALKVRPRYIDFGTLYTDQPKLYQTLVVSFGGGSSKWNSISVATNHLIASVVKQDDKSYLVRIGLDPSRFTQIGPFTESVSLTPVFDGVALPNERIVDAVDGNLKVRGLDILPASTFVGIVQRNQIFHGEINFQSSQNIPIHISSIVCAPTANQSIIHTSVVPEDNATKNILKYSINPINPGNISTVLCVKFEYGQSILLAHIPIVGICQ